MISHNILNSKGNNARFSEPFYLSGLKTPQNVRGQHNFPVVSERLFTRHFQLRTLKKSAQEQIWQISNHVFPRGHEE